MDDLPTPEDLEIAAAYEADLEAKQNGSGVRRKFVGLTDADRADYAAMEKLHPGKSITFVWDKVEQERRRVEAVDRKLVYGSELALPSAPTPWVSKWLRIAPGRPSVWCGEGGTAKSLLASWVAMHVATGRHVFGNPVQQMPVLWMDYEAGKEITKKRLQRMARVMGSPLEGIDRDIAYKFRPLYLDGIGKQKELEDFVDGFGLVVVDSLSRCAPMLDENRAEASIPLELMMGVSESKGTNFVVLDHAGKPPQMPGGRKKKHLQRGHSRKLDAAGTMWAMEKPSKRSPTLVSCEREQIEGIYPDDWTFDIVDVAKDGDPRWGLELKETRPEPKRDAFTEIKLRLLEAAKTYPRSSQRKLLGIAKGDRNLGTEAFAELLKEGKLKELGKNEYVAH